jgi:hypothetical protein
MIQQQNKLKLGIYSIFIFISFIIITDFIFPGNVVIDEIIEVKKTREQYYNAAQNHHYSYKIITSTDQFSVSEDFAKELSANQ